MSKLRFISYEQNMASTQDLRDLSGKASQLAQAEYRQQFAHYDNSGGIDCIDRPLDESATAGTGENAEDAENTNTQSKKTQRKHRFPAILSVVYNQFGKDADNRAGQEHNVIDNLDLSTRVDTPYQVTKRVFELSPPQLVFKGDELKQFLSIKPQNDRELPAGFPTPEHNAAFAQLKMENKMPAPTDQALLQWWYTYNRRFLNTFSFKDIDKDRLKKFQDHLRYFEHLDITFKQIRSCIRRRVNLFSAGSTPYTNAEMDRELQLQEDLAMPTDVGHFKDEEKCKDRVAKGCEKREKEHEHAKKVEQFIPKQMFLTRQEKNAARAVILRDDQGRRIVEQDEVIKVSFHAIERPEHYSKFRITLDIHYKDPSRPYIQPNEFVTIEIDQTNGRSGPAIVKGERKEFTMEYRLQTIDHPEILHALCPHLTTEAVQNIVSLCQTERQLALLTLCRNDQPHTENLFNLRRERTPAAHSALRMAMRNSPTLYVIVRARMENFSDRTHGVMGMLHQ